MTEDRMREALEAIKVELEIGFCPDGQTLEERMYDDPPDYTCLRDSLLRIGRIVNSFLGGEETDINQPENGITN